LNKLDFPIFHNNKALNIAKNYLKTKYVTVYSQFAHIGTNHANMNSVSLAHAPLDTWKDRDLIEK
jgi:hypothetical protein